MLTGLLFHKNHKSLHSSPVIQQSSLQYSLFKLVVVVRHEHVTSLSNVFTYKEIKYNQTQPNSTEPMRTFWTEERRSQSGVEGWSAVGQLSPDTCRERPPVGTDDLWHRSEREWRSCRARNLMTEKHELLVQLAGKRRTGAATAAGPSVFAAPHYVLTHTRKRGPQLILKSHLTPTSPLSQESTSERIQSVLSSSKTPHTRPQMCISL